MKLDPEKLYVVRNKLTGEYLKSGASYACWSKKPVFHEAKRVMAILTARRQKGTYTRSGGYKYVGFEGVYTLVPLMDLQIKEAEIKFTRDYEAMDYYLEVHPDFKKKGRKKK